MSDGDATVCAVDETRGNQRFCGYELVGDALVRHGPSNGWWQYEG